ncbi:MAG: phosphoethanolamine transferase [Succinimonas sp.]|nr:phosphoethanolamine transferase [Succinimonas sp.]
MLFAVLVYTAVRPPLKFLTSYLSLTLLYLGIPVLGLMSGHKTPAHEFLASFLAGNFLYFSALYLKLAPEKIVSPVIGKLISYGAGLLYLGTFVYAVSFYVYYLANGGILEGDIILAIAQTNIREALTYLETAFSGWQLAALTVLSLPVLFGGWLSVKAFHKLHGPEQVPGNVPRIFRAAAGVFIVFFMFVLAQGMLSQSSKGYGCQAKQVLAFSVYMLRSYGNFEKNREEIISSIRFDETAAKEAEKLEKGVYVLIIGESANRDHWGLYGYKYDTTPLINRRIAKQNDGYRFIYFRNAYSSFTHTVESVTNALTNVNQYNGGDLSRAVSLIDIANKAGFDTYWISNQSADSMIVTPLTAISMSAGSIKFVSESRNGGKIFDLDILDNLPQKLNPDRNSLIVIHLMGSHTKYRDRYPQEFSKFSAEAGIINEYDNSIGYTDYVIDRLFKHFSENTNLMFIGYVSDHGADPSQMGNDHNTTHFVFDMVRVPFVAGFSEKYRKARGSLVNTLSARADECFTNDLIFDLMLGITGLSSNYYRKSYDLSSESYSVNCGNALTLLGSKHVSEDPGLTVNTK